MKYKCKECGRIYSKKPNFCKCGNNQFTTVRTKAEREAITGSIKKNKEKVEKQKEKQKAPFIILLFGLFLFGMYVSFNKIKFEQEKQPEINDEYLTSIRERMLQDFDPTGITNSGDCIITFKIKKDGTLYDKLMEQKSAVQFINDRVMGMLILTDNVDEPPRAYTDVPIRIKFGCIADEKEVSCYSKNIVEEEQQ